MMKKVISIILSIVLIISCCIPAFANEKKQNPTILISGFLCSQLYLNYGEENEERIWKLDMSKVTDRISDDLPRFLTTLAGLFVGKTDEFGATVGDGAATILDALRCNPDGSSAYPLTHYPNDPATSNLAYMYANGLEDKLYETNFCKHLSEQTDPNQIYCFQYDSRFDAITIAEQLNEFIKEVKAYTGADKVNIFALSFGGLISSTYLALYGEQNDLDRLVMSVPAIGGTNIPDRVFRGNVDFPIGTLIQFFETILFNEGNIARMFETAEFETLNKIIESAADGISSTLLYWGSMWSLCSTDLYEDLKKDFLDPVESKNIIEKNDRLHYEIRPSFPEVFKKFRANGGSVSILCATGSTLATGSEYNSDLVLPVYTVSGATCSPLGQRFADGYTGVGTSCSNPEHNHVSPSMEIDASSAYLPENTWFIEDQYHGQYYYEEYTRSLVTKLLLTDDIKDVHSDPDYPQFEYSNNPYRTLHAKFNNSLTGYLSDKDTSVIIENLSTECYIRILSVSVAGTELDFDISGSGIIKPGEETEIYFSGNIPDVGATASQLTVSYIKLGSMNPMCISDFEIMINNGTAPDYSEKLVSSGFESKLEKALPDFLYSAIVKLSLRQSIECIYNSITELF